MSTIKKIEKIQKKYCIIDKNMVNYNYLIEVATLIESIGRGRKLLI